MADTIATREFIERTLDERVGVINTRLQDISGSTAENTADLLSAVSSDVNETFSRMEQEGVTIESRTTADLKTALVRTINKVAEESAGSGGGGGTVTPPAEEEQEPVNLLQAPITVATNEDNGIRILDYSLGLEIGKSYRLSGTYGVDNTVFNQVAEYSDIGDGFYMLVLQYPDADNPEAVINVADKWTIVGDEGPVYDENSALLEIGINETALPLTLNSITEVVESTTAEPIVVEADDITAMFMEEEGMVQGMAIANASMKGWETLYTMGSKIEMVLNGSPVNLELYHAEDDRFAYYQEFDPNEDPFESGEPFAIVQVVLNYRMTEDFDMVEEQGTVGFMIQLFNPANGTSTTIDKITLPPIAFKDINARVAIVVLGHAYPQFDLSKVYTIGQYGFAGYGSANHSPFDLHIPANVQDVEACAFENANFNKITIDENAFLGYILNSGLFCGANIADGANSNIDAITMKLDYIGEECFYGFDARTLRLNFDKIRSFSENSFRNCYVKSINSDVDGEWLFGDEETTSLEFGENAFRYAQPSKLKFIYPNVNEVSVKDKAFYWQTSSASLEEFVLQTSPSCSTFVLNKSNAEFSSVPLETLIVPRAEISKHCIPTDLVYLDCYKLTFDTNYYNLNRSMETLVYRDTAQSFIPTELLSGSAPIMQGAGVVYVQDNLVGAYENTYSGTAIVFKGISELE